MCIYIFGQVICIDNVILVACATMLLGSVWWIKKKWQDLKRWFVGWRTGSVEDFLGLTPEEVKEIERKLSAPDEWVDAEEVFERLKKDANT